MGKSKDKVRKQSKDTPMESDETRRISDFKNRAVIKQHGVDNTQTFEHPGGFTAVTKELDPNSLKTFAKNVDIDIRKINADEIVFDLKGVEPPLANALRRIMIAEIPTIAIEKVTMWQNTSIIPDENLAHRIGLVPIKVDPSQFAYHEQGKEYSEGDSLKFRLHKICTKKDPSAPMVLNNTHQEE